MLRSIDVPAISCCSTGGCRTAATIEDKHGTDTGGKAWGQGYEGAWQQKGINMKTIGSRFPRGSWKLPNFGGIKQFPGKKSCMVWVGNIMTRVFVHKMDEEAKTLAGRIGT